MADPKTLLLQPKPPKSRLKLYPWVMVSTRAGKYPIVMVSTNNSLVIKCHACREHVTMYFPLELNKVIRRCPKCEAPLKCRISIVPPGDNGRVPKKAVRKKRKDQASEE